MEREVKEARSERPEAGESPGVSRRSFLDGLLAGMVALLVAATVYPIVRYLWPSYRRAAAGRERSLSIPLGQVPEGAAHFTKFGGESVVVVRTEESVYALSAVCTHLGCIVKWDQARGQLICPCHAAIFDVNGNVLGGPAPRPLPSYGVRVVGDKIVLEEA